MSERSNIAIFSYAFRPLIGGAERAVEEITARASHRRFTCFTNHFSGTLEKEHIGNVEVIRVGSGTPYQVSKLEKLRYVFLAI